MPSSRSFTCRTSSPTLMETSPMKKIVKTPDPVYRPIVLFDVDGVLADFTSAILELVKRHTTVHHHIEECTDWDLFEIFTKKHPEVSDLKDKLHAATLAEGFCRSLA